jgi:DNA-directed RNA polymerase subunit RPC12/RpoP
MYTVVSIRFGPEIVVLFIANAEQVSEIVDFVKASEGSAIDVIEEIETRFDVRSINDPEYFDPYGWDKEKMNNPFDSDKNDNITVYSSYTIHGDTFSKNYKCPVCGERHELVDSKEAKSPNFCSNCGKKVKVIDRE